VESELERAGIRETRGAAVVSLIVARCCEARVASVARVGIDRIPVPQVVGLGVTAVEGQRIEARPAGAKPVPGVPVGSNVVAKVGADRSN